MPVLAYKILIPIIALAVLGGGFKLYISGKERAAVEVAGNQATIEAYSEQEDFDSAQGLIALQEVEQLKLIVAENSKRHEKSEARQRMDWDADLQNSPDFVARANRATERVFERKGRQLQEVFAQ